MRKIIMASIVAVSLTAGCAHPTSTPVFTPPTTVEVKDMATNPYRLPVLPPPVPTAEPMVRVVEHTPTIIPCGHSLTVKVGKLDVNMPQGGSIEIPGMPAMKASTKAYHIILEGVEFTNTDRCLTTEE